MKAGAVGKNARAAIAVALAVGLAVAYLARRADLPAGERPALLVAAAALALLFLPFFGLSFETVIRRLRRAADRRPGRALLLAAALAAPYLLYWAVPGRRNLSALLTMTAVAGVPCAIALAWPPGRRVGDLLVVLSIWLPLEFRWASLAFPWPEGGSGKVVGVVLGVDLLVYLMVVVRRVDGIGYSLVPRARELAPAVAAFVAFAAVGIPIGLQTGFLEPARSLPGPLEGLLRTFGIFLITAVPEELLFRGLLQGFLERWTGRSGVALIVASILFGVAHLNNGPAPDWRYATLAALAGLAYGWVYQRTRRIAPAAVTHALVDGTWSILF
ncbi:MAG: lysostaphin resistance A-like protein [Acidobacteriota bacterium]